MSCFVAVFLVLFLQECHLEAICVSGSEGVLGRPVESTLAPAGGRRGGGRAFPQKDQSLDGHMATHSAIGFSV